MKSFLKSIVVYVLTLEARVLLKRQQPTIVAVTGSVGKTSTKDAIYAAVKKNTSARKSEKSFNSGDIGVQLTILGLSNGWNNPFKWLRNLIDGFFIAFFSKKYPGVLILEAGIDRPGDMAKLTTWIKPDIVVLTKLTEIPPHIEYFSSAQSVVDEKMLLVQAMKPDGVLIYNHDDNIIKANLKDVLQRSVGYGRYLETDFTARADKIIYHDDLPVGVEFNLKHLDQTGKIKITGTIGTQHVYSCSAAVAVASELEISLTEAVASLQTLQTQGGRMRINPGIKSTTLIDDTYNSSPVACEQALQALQELKYCKRKIVVLGDMLELGKYSSSEHKRIGSIVPDSADILFTIGVRARQIAEGALATGMNERNIFQYDDVARAGSELQAFLELGDVVLIKASQSIHAERVVVEVMANPEQAPQLLVRQDKSWKDKLPVKSL